MTAVHRLVPALLVLALAASAQEEESAAAEHMKAAGEKFRGEDYEGAIEEFGKAIAADPSLLEAWTGRAQAKLRLERYGQAIADLDKALELNPKAWVVVQMRGGAKAAAHDYEGALADYEEALELNPRLWRAFLARARIHESMGELDKAFEDYAGAMAIVPTLGAAYLGQAGVHAARGDFEAAKEPFDAAVYLANEPEAKADVFATRGRARLEQGELEKAAADFEMAVKTAPESARAHFGRGRFLLDAGEPKRALADFRKVLALQAEGNEYARLYLCLARMRLGEKDEGRAELGAYADMRERKGDWFEKVALFLAGRTEEEGFFASAKTGNEHLTRERECEAYFYAAMVRDIAGEEDEARAYAEECVARGVVNFIEYASAKAWLALHRGGGEGGK